jgi:type I restriction enzyme M protein
VNQSATIVQRLWNYCNVLRDDGLSYGDYLEQLTFLLFLKMDGERVRELGMASAIPEAFNWASLTKLDGDALESHYRTTLIELGRGSGLIPVIFRKAQNKAEDQGKRLVNGVTLLLAGPACNRQPVPGPSHCRVRLGSNLR